MHTVTVVPADKLIICDGVALFFDFQAPDGLHALQWRDDAGHTEWTGGPNRPLTVEDYDEQVAPYVALWRKEKTRREEMAAEEAAARALPDAKAAKCTEIQNGYDAALAASLTMPATAPTAQDVAVGAALLAVEDAEGLAYVQLCTPPAVTNCWPLWMPPRPWRPCRPWSWTMTYRLAGQIITAPDTGGHGLDMSNGQDWLVEDCLIDLSACPLGQLDEAVGVVWGSSAIFRRCVIRGAGKLVLCGSGDTDKLNVERGKTVIFEDCILEDFGRRGCLIRNWGAPDRFDVRSCGAWAHHGGSIEAVGCVFDQPRFWRGWQIMVRDWLAHIGQSWNDEGLRGLLRPANWLPGVCRGLVATAGGQVWAENCHATRWWIRLEGHCGPRMGRKEASAVVERRERLRAELTGRFPAAACLGR